MILDLATIRDKATFVEPHQHSEGIDYVFINGTAVVDAGKLTHATPGKSSFARARRRRSNHRGPFVSTFSSGVSIWLRGRFTTDWSGTARAVFFQKIKHLNVCSIV